MTGTNATLCPPPPAQPVCGPLPEALAALESEFFVEWQVSPHAVNRREK